MFYHYDGLGSTRALSDGTGALTDTYDYEAFGEVLNRTGTTENNYQFTGEQFDQNLNQYYLRARYYDQNVGRFTQMDTWMGNNHDPVTLNKYLYANADPVLLIDPSGMYSQSFGYAVEKKVEEQYKAANPHCITQSPSVARNCLFGARAYFSASRYLKPDIVDFTNKSFNEIKPLSPSGIASGKAQISIYSRVYGSSPFFFHANTQWVPNPVTVQNSRVYFVNIDGLIFYTDERRVYNELGAATLATLAIIYKNSTRSISTKLGADAVAAGAIRRGVAANRSVNTMRMQMSFGIGFGLGLF